MAKIYIAESFVRVDGELYTKGEVLPEGLDEEKAAWLLSTGAIRESAYEPEEAPAPEPEPEPKKAVKAEKPKAKKAVEPVYEDEEIPEIDAMEGIVKPKAEKKKTAKGGKK